MSPSLLLSPFVSTSLHLPCPLHMPKRCTLYSIVSLLVCLSSIIVDYETQCVLLAVQSVLLYLYWGPDVTNTAGHGGGLRAQRGQAHFNHYSTEGYVLGCYSWVTNSLGVTYRFKALWVGWFTWPALRACYGVLCLSRGEQGQSGGMAVAILSQLVGRAWSSSWPLFEERLTRTSHTLFWLTPTDRGLVYLMVWLICWSDHWEGWDGWGSAQCCTLAGADWMTVPNLCHTAWNSMWKELNALVLTLSAWKQWCIENIHNYTCIIIIYLYCFCRTQRRRGLASERESSLRSGSYGATRRSRAESCTGQVSNGTVQRAELRGSKTIWVVDCSFSLASP